MGALGPTVVPHRVLTVSGPLRAVHLSRHKWPGGLVNEDAVLSLTTPFMARALTRQTGTFQERGTDKVIHAGPHGTPAGTHS